MLKIVRDPTLSAHHITAIEGINFIFNTFAMRCVPFIHQVFPVYLGLIRNSEHKIREVTNQLFFVVDHYVVFSLINFFICLS
jgi:FKBP12-rapamycin complex-associated protein